MSCTSASIAAQVEGTLLPSQDRECTPRRPGSRGRVARVESDPCHRPRARGGTVEVDPREASPPLGGGRWRSAGNEVRNAQLRPTALKGISVLLVDDNPDELAVARRRCCASAGRRSPPCQGRGRLARAAEAAAARRRQRPDDPGARRFHPHPAHPPHGEGRGGRPARPRHLRFRQRRSAAIRPRRGLQRVHVQARPRGARRDLARLAQRRRRARA